MGPGLKINKDEIAVHWTERIYALYNASTK
jgi:hypothetical protein